MHNYGGVFLDFYSKFEKLCQSKGVTFARVREELGISQSTMASWKSRGLTPKYETAKKLSDYFGVSVDYLLGNEEKEKSTGESVDGLTDVYFRLAKSFQDDKVDPDDIRLALDTIKRLREKK